MGPHTFKAGGQRVDETGTLLELYRLSSKDLEHVRAFGKVAVPRMSHVIESWYTWLETQPEFDQFFAEPETLRRVKGLQTDYWNVFMKGDVHDEYVDSRRRIGEAHARIGLPLNTYFAGMNMFLELLIEVVRESDMSAEGQLACQEAVTKLLHFDSALVVETYNRLVEETLTAQSKSLMEMSTPVTQIWNGILLLPIVGIIDSKRARDVMNATLAKIGDSQARIFILDISGVGVVDTAVANHIIKITKATRLMGCECTISGVSPSIAQTIVDLGIEVGDIKTTATMKDALADAFHRVGAEISQKH